MLKKGSKGKEVTELQDRLNQFSQARLVVDGQYGEHTVAAVEAFQEENGLLVDGIVGPQTWGLLREVRPPLTSDLFERSKYKELAEKNARSPEAAAVLVRAVRDIGKKENPSGSNFGDEIAHLVLGYKEYWQIKTLAYPPWCAIAVSSWIRIGFGEKSWEDTPFKKWFGAVSQITKWGQKNNCFFEPGEKEIKGGDIIILDRAGSSSDRASSKVRRAGHTGLIIADEGDRLLTIEANVSNRVKVCYRPKSMIKGIVTWS